MGELTARNLVGCGLGVVFVSNRSFDRAQRLVEQFNGQAISFHNFLFWHRYGYIYGGTLLYCNGSPARELMENRGGGSLYFSILPYLEM